MRIAMNMWAVFLILIMMLPGYIVLFTAASLVWVGEKLDDFYWGMSKFRQKVAPFYYEKYDDPELVKRANDDL